MVSPTRAAKDPDWAFVPLGAVFLSVSEMWHMSKSVQKSASFFEFLGHTWNMSKPVMTFVFKVLRNRLLQYMSKPVMTLVFKVLRNRLLRYINETCPNLWWRSCSKCYAIDCFGTYLKHVDLWWRSVQSATHSTASVHTWNMSKTVMTFVFKVLRNRLLRYTYLKHVQTCDDVRVQSATQSTASVHTWNMSKPVMTFVFKVPRNRLLRYIVVTCPNLWWRSCSKCYAVDCFGTYLKHVLGRVCFASLWNHVYLVHDDEILMGTAWFRARATKDPKRCLGCIRDHTTQLCGDYNKPLEGSLLNNQYFHGFPVCGTPGFLVFAAPSFFSGSWS